MPSFRALLCYLLLSAGLLPVWSNMPVVVSEKGSLLPVVVSKCAFKDLSLPEALQLLSGRTGLLYGIAYSENAPELVARRSIEVSAPTTVAGILRLLATTYPEYKFNVTDRTVEALPKHLEGYRMGWLTDKAFNFTAHAEEPIVAAEQFCAREDVVKAALRTLPLAHPGHGFTGRGMVDLDGDTLLISRSYQQATARAILSDLAFGSGQSWVLCFPRPNPITADHAVLWFQTCVDQPPSPELHLTLPKGYSVKYTWTRHYFAEYAQLKIRKFHCEQHSILAAFDRLCAEIGIHYMLVLPNDALRQTRTFEIHDTDFLTLLHDLFAAHGYTCVVSETTGMLLITPREEAGKPSPAMSALLSPLHHGGYFGVNWTTALPTINAYLKAQVPEMPITVESEHDLSKTPPFTYRVPWDGSPFTPLLLISGLAHKLNCSVLIEERDHALAAVVATSVPQPAETPFILIMTEPSEHSPY